MHYLMGKFEVTQSQWESIMGYNPSLFKGADDPVENVSWNDCQEFLSKLNALPAVKESGLLFRLPTEEEWMYACRAGATGDYCKLADGTEITEDTLGRVAWFDENSGARTHPVGKKLPNAFGLYDMHGNVWEWTSTADGHDRVDCGGGWNNVASDCESFTRGRGSPSVRDDLLGFRLCVSRRNERNDMITSIIETLVSIPDRHYLLGKYEVTQSQWEAVMENNPSVFKVSDNPVENVSWNDCQEFLSKLNALPAVKESGLLFRLPTEEEWMYACRAGATGDYCKLADGTEITEDTLGRVAWFKDNADERTHPVGQKQPNGFGLYDMHGNVCEWTQTTDNEGRISRGGGWDNSAERCESSYRSRIWLFDPGFRLCASRGVAQKNATTSDNLNTDETKKLIANMVPIPGKDYLMGKYEVMQSLWEAVMGSNPSFFKGGDNPVENMSWDDCQKFLKKLNSLPAVEESGLVFRLPTDAEWEFACRAGATGKYCKLASGTEISETTLGQVAWYEGNAGKTTHPVGQKEPNAFGLYDMHGNVWEWCQDEIGEVWDYAKGKDFQHDRVNRGGGFAFASHCCESSCRYGLARDDQHLALGFRLCAEKR